MILGIDTSAGQCSVALVDGVDCEWCSGEPMERGHAERLFEHIETVLRAAGAGYADIARVGVCVGPGSFTGVRIGVSAARGLAVGRGIPAIGISRLEALAADAEGIRAVAIAMRDKVAFQLFDGDLGPRRLPTLVDPDALEGLTPESALRLGDGWPGEDLPALADPTAIARLAGVRETNERPAPLYLREADAALPREGPPPLLDA